MSDDLKTLAFDELREDESTKKESLQKLKSWIEKNPAIKKCRTDDLFLLRFLRTKKYSLPLAQSMLERYLAIRQLYPNWFKKLDVDDPKINELIDSGYIFALPNRDDLGRKVIMTNISKFDSSKYTAEDMVRLHSLVFESFMDDDENQIRGYTEIHDETGLSMTHLSIWSLTDIRNIIKCIQNSLPVRHKATHLLNLPPSANKIFEFFTALLSDKLKKRVFVHKTVEDLKKSVGEAALPEEYGGKLPTTDFKNHLKSKKANLLALDEMEIDLSVTKAVEDFDDANGISGSFRKLQID